MHEACAKFAAKACPFLNGTKREYAANDSKTEKAQVDVVKFKNEPPPSRMGILLVRSYQSFARGLEIYFVADLAKRRVIWNAMPEVKHATS